MHFWLLPKDRGPEGSCPQGEQQRRGAGCRDAALRGTAKGQEQKSEAATPHLHVGIFRERELLMQIKCHLSAFIAVCKTPT